MVRHLLTLFITLLGFLSLSAQEEYFYIWQGGNAYQFDAAKTDSIDFDAPRKTSFTIGGMSFVVMEQGEVQTLNFQSVPAILIQDVKWSSSNEDVAVVANGAVFAKSAGMATITAESNGLISQRTVIIKEKKTTLESISFAETNATLKQYELLQLFPILSPETYSAKNIEWKSSDESIVEVLNGVVIAKNQGTAIVTASIDTLSAGVEIKVLSNLTGITANETKYRLIVDSALALKDLGVRLLSGDSAKMSYTTSDANIVDIVGDSLIAKSVGKATITATMGEYSIDIEIETYIAEYELIAIKKEFTLLAGDIIPLSDFGVSVEPFNAEYKPIEWSIDGVSAMISVETFVALMPGQVTLTAKSGEKSISLIINIEQKATEIKAVNELTLNEGSSLDTFYLKIKITPFNTTDSLTLESTDTSIISIVNRDIIGKKEGECSIIAKVGDLQAEIDVKVIPVPKSLTFENDEITISSINTNGVALKSSLGMKILPENAVYDENDLIWQISGGDVIKLEKREGKMYIVPVADEDSEATVTITLGKLSATAKVKVKVSLSDITIDSDPLRIAVDSAFALSDLKVVVFPANTKDEVTFKSSNEEIFTIEEGKIIGKKKGTAKLLATFDEIAAPLDVTVFQPILSVDSKRKNINLIVGNGGVSVDTFGVSYLPLDADDVKITWECEDESIAKVKNILGTTTVVPVAKGKTKLIAHINDFELSFDVNVSVPIEYVNIVPETLEMVKGTDMVVWDIEYDFAPSDGVIMGDGKIWWAVEDETIATVENNGSAAKLKALKVGQTKLSLRFGDKSDNLVLNVVCPADTITLNATELTMEKGETFAVANFEPTILPADATDKNIVWSSSDTNVAEIKSILGTLVIKANGGGTATITAKVGEKTAKVNLTVTVPVESVAIAESELVINKGEAKSVDDLTVSVLPLDATDKSISWSVADTAIAKVENGDVKALSVGTTKLTASVGGKTATVPVRVVSPLTKIVFDKEEYTIDIDDVLGLHSIVSYLPEDATDVAIEWSVNDESIATVQKIAVSNTSILKPKNSGEVILKATSGSVSDSVKVVVNVPLKGISLEQESVSLGKGEKLAVADLGLSFTPANASNKSVVWSSENENVAKVEKNAEGEYEIVAVDGGSTTITVSQGEIKASVAVKVIVGAGEIVVPSKPVEMTPNEKKNAADLGIRVLPENVTDKTLTYKSSDESVVKIVSLMGNTLISAVSSGEATITVTCGELESTFSILVKIPLESIAIEKSEIAVGKGVKFGVDTLGISFEPENATYTELLWSSSDETIAKIDDEGNFIALSDGEATFTGKTKEDSAVSFKVIISDALESITLNKNAATMVKGTSLDLIKDLELTFVPANATDKNVVWSSTDEDVAIVKDGKIEAVGAGSCTIKGETSEGVSVSIDITVYVPLESISFTESKVTIARNKSLDVEALGVVFTPANATYTTLEWKSSDEAVAVVEDGKIKAIERGTCTITAISQEGITASVEVEVNVPLEGIKLKTDAINMYLTQTFDVSLLEPQPIPADADGASDMVYAFSTSGDAVSLTGTKVRAEYAGTSKISVSSNGKSASANISVTDKIVYSSKPGYEFTMIIVDGGTYKMGDPSEDGPIVSVAPFMIGETEMTQGMWIYKSQANTNKGDNQPVSSFNSDNADDAIDSLSSYCRINSGLPEECRFTLPTEIEWEWAARGGKLSKGYRFAGSNDISEVAWTTEEVTTKGATIAKPAITQEVKGKLPNELGIYDMCGNVSEWCVNSGDDKTATEHINSKGKLIFGNVGRGGSISTISNAALRLTGKVDQIKPNDCNVYYRDTKANSVNITRGVRLVLPNLPFPAEITELK